MDRRIRVLGFFLVVCFALLVLQLNNIQIRQAPALANSKYQPTTSTDPYTQPRGEIVSADGVVMARSVPSNDADQELRVYPDGPLFADVTGYYDIVDHAAPYGLEDEYNNYLSIHQATSNNLSGLLTEQSGTDTVVTTISARLQAVARTALAGRVGAVVAIEPATGAVLVMYGNPTYNPNLLSNHDTTEVHKAYSELSDAANPSQSPLINYATDQTSAPGSTMKVVTTSAIFDHDPSLETMNWPFVSRIPLPQTNLTLQNFRAESCGGNLAEILAKSCDTAYAEVGLSLGAQSLAAEASAFGFNEVPPIDLPAGEVTRACFPGVGATGTNAPGCSGVPIGPQNLPGLAYSAIGQDNVTETVLQNALVVSAIADGGVIMTPHLLARVVDESGGIVQTESPTPWRTATSAATASSVRQLMVGVAQTGTAAGLFPPSLHIAAKTGTAEVGGNNCSTNWLVATGPAGVGDTPQIAVAAIVPYQPGLSAGCDGTGATVAGPIVASVIDAFFGVSK